MNICRDMSICVYNCHYNVLKKKATKFNGILTMQSRAYYKHNNTQ